MVANSCEMKKKTCIRNSAANVKVNACNFYFPLCIFRIFAIMQHHHHHRWKLDFLNWLTTWAFVLMARNEQHFLFAQSLSQKLTSFFSGSMRYIVCKIFVTIRRRWRCVRHKYFTNFVLHAVAHGINIT